MSGLESFFFRLRRDFIGLCFGRFQNIPPLGDNREMGNCRL